MALVEHPKLAKIRVTPIVGVGNQHCTLADSCGVLAKCTGSPKKMRFRRVVHPSRETVSFQKRSDLISMVMSVDNNLTELTTSQIE
jgi:hypothetical protein